MAKSSSAPVADQAKQLGLQAVTVTAADVAIAPTDVLPLPIIEARKLFPYRLDNATKTLFVAVADPAQLKQPAPAELQAQRQRGRSLKLQLITPDSFTALLPAIRERFAMSASQPQPTPAPVPTASASEPQPLTASNPPATPATPAVPTVDLKTLMIPRAVFLKIPHDVATKFRIIVVEASADGSQVKLATDQPTDPGVARVVKVIQAKRGVTVQVVQAPQEQVNGLLAAYETTADPISLTPLPVTRTVPISLTPAPAVAAMLAAANPMPVPPRPTPSVLPPVAAPVVMPNPAVTPPVAAPVLPMPPLPVAAVKPVSTPQTAPKPAAQPAPTVPAPTSIAKSVTPNPAKPTEPNTTAVAKPIKPATGPNDLPVDTSAVTKKVDESQPANITLAAPLALQREEAGFPMPTIPGSAQTYVATTETPLTPPANAITPPLVATPAPASPTLTKPLGSAALGAKPIAQSIAPRTVSIQPPAPTNPGALTPLSTIQASDDQNLDAIVGATIRSTEDLEAVVKTGLVPKILAAILQYAVNVGASDVHAEATETGLRIRIRIDGILQDLLQAPLSLDAPFVSRVKILSGMKIDEQRIPQDGRFTAIANQHEIDFRVSTLPAIHGEKLVMRILDKSIGVRSIDQLGLDGSNAERVATALKKPFGIILVTGPTGSGKTTTLYAMLSGLNQPGVNIVTLEDPVEYELPGITQTQVKPKIGFSFAEGLRSILRQDPDIIMVGEIRDRETASLATQAALTGHLVLATLHTNNAAGAIPRFLDMGVEGFLIASSIDSVIAQRLVRRLCDNCKQPGAVSDVVQQNVVATLNSSVVPAVKAAATQPMQFFAPHGCEQCHDGYKGRLGIYEVMTVSPEIEAMTTKHGTLPEIETLAEAQGMVTMKQDGILKALQGLTSLDEVLRVTSSEL